MKMHKSKSETYTSVRKSSKLNSKSEIVPIKEEAEEEEKDKLSLNQLTES